MGYHCHSQEFPWRGHFFHSRSILLLFLQTLENTNYFENLHTMPPKGSRKGKAPVRGHGKGKAPARTIPNSAVPANTNQAESTPAVSNPAKAEQVQPPPASFMGLPPEIQQRIYRYALYTPYNLPLIPKREPNTTLQKTKRAILRVNKEVYNGASVVFYHENKFQFEIESHGKKLVDAVFKPHLGDMRHIILRYSYSPMLEVRSIDKSIARFLQMVLDNCPALKTLVLFCNQTGAWAMTPSSRPHASCRTYVALSKRIKRSKRCFQKYRITWRSLRRAPMYISARPIPAFRSRLKWNGEGRT